MSLSAKELLLAVVKKIKMEVFFDITLNLQEHPTHKSLQWMQQRMPRTYEMIMETLQIYAWPKYCNMYCIPQSLDIHDKDIGINLVICILSNNKIAMMKDVNNSNVRYS